uniref:Phosphorylase b kinase regulatory subunit n=1 Tax=Acanthochromis polyacanthus TaxID=80966 RepID=A0A3Q1FIH6_9TELE
MFFCFVSSFTVNGVKDERIDRAIGVCKKAVSAFSYSWKKRRDMAEVQAELGLPPHQLVTESLTRWGSRQKMIDRFLEQEKAIVRVLGADKKSRHLVPTWQDLEVLEATNKAVKPLQDFTDALSGEAYVSVSYIKPVLHLFRTSLLQPQEEDVALTATIKRNIMSYLDKKYSDPENDELLDMASLMDPRFRSTYIDPSKLDLIKKRAVTELSALYSQNSSETSVCENQRSDSPPKKKTLAAFFKKAVPTSLPHQTESDKIEAELNSYLLSPKDASSVNLSVLSPSQGPIENDVVIHAALIAESQRLQVFLNTYGIQTQTPQQVEPIQIWPQKELVKAYRFLAINKKLGLSGRPDRPVGCIGTCKIYRILGKTVVCYPIVFDLSDFYLSQDVMLLIDDIKNALQFIKQCWKMQGRPLFLVLIREDNIKGSRFNPVLDMLAAFKKGNIGGVKVHVDRLQTLISGAVVEQLDFLRVNEAEIPEFKSFEELEMPKHSKVKRQTSTPNASDLEQQPEISVEEWQHKSTQEIIQKFHDCDCLASQAQLASILLRREGPDFLSKDENLMDELERIYRRAGSRKLWSVVRLAASLLTKLVDSLAPSITSVLVHGKQVTLGLFGHEEEVISNPLSPGVIQGIIYSKCSPHGGEREAVLQQELVIHIGWIISNNPELFSGMLKIRVGWIVQAMKHELKIRAGDMPPQDIYQLSPSDIKQLLLDVLQPQHTGRSWLNRRQVDGSLNRTPLGFYDRVWQILERTPNGIVVAENHLPQQPSLSDMTMYEMNFSLLVEDTLKNIVLPEYRQIIVELLMVVSIVLERNPELEFSDKVDLDGLVKEAFNDFQRDRSRFEGMEKQDNMEAFYNTPPVGKRGTSSYLTKAVMILLLQGDVKPCKDDPCSVS